MKARWEQANLEALPDAPGEGKRELQSFASVGIELPLWNRNQGNLRAAEADLDQARQEITRTQLSLRQQAEALLQKPIFPPKKKQSATARPCCRALVARMSFT